MILQVSVVGIIAVGMTQVIITGGIDLSSGSVVGATAMIAMSFAQVEHLSARRVHPSRADRPAGHRAGPGRAWGRAARRADQRRADRLYEDSALHRDARHDGVGARARQMVDQGPARVIPHRRVRGDRQGHDAGLHLARRRRHLPHRAAIHQIRQAHLCDRLQRGGRARRRHQGRASPGAGLRDRRHARRAGRAWCWPRAA